MKRYIRLLIGILLFVPIFVMADKPYDQGQKIANDYIYSLPEYSRYLISKGNQPFGYDGNSVTNADGFSTGGFLNEIEYERSKKSGGSSYLAPGIQYWLIPKAGHDYAALDLEPRYNNLTTSGVRVTEFVQHNTKVKGTGTITTPWEFIDGYKVRIGTTDKSKGEITGVSVYEHVPIGSDRTFTLELKGSYDVNINECKNNRNGNFLITDDPSDPKKKNIVVSKIIGDYICNIDLGSGCNAVTFNDNSGSDGMGSKNKKIYYKYGSGWYNESSCRTVASSSDIYLPTRKGYIFNEYKYNSKTIINNSKNLYTNLVDDSIVSGAEAKADWTPITYKITYNCNGGKGSTAESTHTYDVEKELTKNGCSRLGYTFNGWSTNENATTIEYKDEKKVKNLSYTQGSTVKLYAVWGVNYAYIYYTALNVKDANVSINKSVTLPSDYLNDDKTPNEYAGTTKYFNLQELNVNIDGVVKKFYNVVYQKTYKTNGEYVPMRSGIANSKIYESHGNGLPHPQNNKTGIYITNGILTVPDKKEWKCASGNCGLATYDQAKIDYKSSDFCNSDVSSCYIVLEPNWINATFKITLNNKGATNSGSTEIYEKHSEGFYLDSAASSSKKMTTSANGITVPSKTGYNFDGYYTSENGGGTKYISSNGKITSSASATYFNTNGTLYAKWIPISYSISYVYNGGTAPNSGVPSSYTYGTGATINGKPTRSGYTFNGWSTSSDLSSPSFTKTIGTTATGNKTFYAKWCQNCANVSNGSCSLNANTAGKCTYTTKCNTGYTISGNGTRNPTCSLSTISYDNRTGKSYATLYLGPNGKYGKLYCELSSTFWGSGVWFAGKPTAASNVRIPRYADVNFYLTDGDNHVWHVLVQRDGNIFVTPYLTSGYQAKTYTLGISPEEEGRI